MRFPFNRIIFTLRSPTSSKQPFIKTYLNNLRSKYPLADPPSLIISFLILHEITAIVPLFLGFFTLKSLGFGEELSNWVKSSESSLSIDGGVDGNEGRGWGREKVGEWIMEGENQAGMIGRRYGAFGFEKESKEDRIERKRLEKEGLINASTIGKSGGGGMNISGDVANLVVAYIVVKATLPLRLLLSARLSPALANVIVKNFKGLRSIGTRYLKKGSKM